ncbi:hypothetical protein OPIT5_04020 [Opitutaceae bacterium TAV5]|nr:hypothetical protein OPIT5_04020 [Opitutaceae bacterium TAV5]
MSDAPKPLDVGLHYGVPAKVYHSDPCPLPSLSSGIARTIIGQSLAHAWLEHPRFGGKGKVATPAMNTGSLVHALLSGNDDEFEIATYDSFKGGAAQAWKASVEAQGKVAVLEKNLDSAHAIVEAVRKKASIGIDNTPFATHGKSEVTAVWKRGEVYCRARYDRLMIDAHSADVWDWKVTSDISDHAINNKIAEFRYDIQAAHYLDGLEATLPEYRGRMSFIFVFVEDRAPHTVRRVVLSDEWANFGRIEQRAAVREWSVAVKEDRFPSLGDLGQTFEACPPAYLANRYADMISTS